jgi:uncharacterized protein involved in response to NO
MQIYVSFFIFGFLMTAGPKFSGAQPASVQEVTIFSALFFSMFVCLVAYEWFFSEMLFVASLLMLGVFLFRRFLKSGGYRPPADFVWIPMGILFGVIGSILSMLARQGFLEARVLEAGKLLKEQGFVLAVVLGVGGFLGPRLMGLSDLMQPSELRSMAEAQKKRSQRIKIHLLSGACLFASFFIESAGWLSTAYSLRALVVTLELFWTTAVYRIPPVRDLFARLLWFSLWMVIVGYWGVAFLPIHKKAMLHLVFIGGFSGMIFSVATMVVLSHAGEGEKLKQRLWSLRFAAGGVILAMLFRVIASFFFTNYFILIGISAVCWLVAGFSWLCFIVPKVLKYMKTGSESC